jgi:hypothetical protein
MTVCTLIAEFESRQPVPETHPGQQLVAFLVDRLPRIPAALDCKTDIPPHAQGALVLAFDLVYPPTNPDRVHAFEWLMDQAVSPDAWIEADGDPRPAWFVAKDQDDLDVFIQGRANPFLEDGRGQTFATRAPPALARGFSEWRDWALVNQETEEAEAGLDEEPSSPVAPAKRPAL